MSAAPPPRTPHAPPAEAGPAKTPLEPNAATTLARLLAADRKFLWGLAYRITGSAADADDVVQDAFARALAQPPERLDEPLRPWLVRVTSRLSIDVLRRRRRHSYVGPWLPSPVDESWLEQGPQGARYDARESVTLAFLLALEALPPKARAVLVLRDVLDLDVAETAAALQMTESNVKVTHLRARQKLAMYDTARVDTSPAAQVRVQGVLNQLLMAVSTGDVATVAALLSPDVVLLSDGGGQYLAARKPVHGAKSVSLFIVKTSRKQSAVQVVPSWLVLAGLPTLHLQVDRPPPGLAPALTVSITLDSDGRIACLYYVLADRKLTAALPYRRPID